MLVPEVRYISPILGTSGLRKARDIARNIPIKEGAAYGWNDVSGPFRYLLEETADYVAEVVGEQVAPTYDILRRYSGESDLPVHVDRLACDVSVAVSIQKSESWGLHFATGDEPGMDREFYLEPGEAVLYYGCMTPHWRVPRRLGKRGGTPNRITQVFLHYVRWSHPFHHQLINDGEFFEGDDYRAWSAEKRAQLHLGRYDRLCEQIAEHYGLECHTGH